KILEEPPAMMKLMWSPLSPYVRKVRMTATMKGLDGRFEPVPSDTNAGDPALNKLNPLGKVPCLITDEGEAIYDSHVICEYLDSLSASPVLFPRSGRARWRTLTLGGLGDGM